MSSKRQDSLAFPLCRFSFADGRRCAQPASPKSNGLCYTHAHATPRRLCRSDLLRELPTDGSPASPAQIQRFLTKLPRAFAEGLITLEDLRAYRHLSQVMLECSRAYASSDPSKLKRVHLVLDDEITGPSDLQNDDLSSYPSRP